METAKNIAQIVAILVAGVWAFSTYVWPEIYRSDQYEPHLFLIAKRDSLHVTEQGVVVSFTILAHNRSNRLLRTVASQYKVSAAIYSTQLSKPSMKVVDALNSEPNALHRWDRWPLQAIDVASLGRFIPKQWVFAPGENYETQVSVIVPCGTEVSTIDLHLLYHHGPADLLTTSWHYDEEKVSIKIGKIQMLGQLVKYEAKNPAHKAIAQENGLKWSISKTQIGIPKCR